MKLFEWFKKPLPQVEPGRQSVSSDDNMGSVLGRLAGFYSFESAPFRLETLAVLRPLAIYNPNVAQALSIWVNLGNTGHEVEIEAKNPDAVLARLNDLAGSVYRLGGGVDGLVNHFLRQIPLYGALSAEWVVADKVTDGMVDVATVPVRQIRFRREEGDWRPYQYTGLAGDNGYVALNPLTYSYSPLQTDDGSPYGIPPFLAALKNIEVQLDGMGNIAAIMRKQGLMGFLDVTMKTPGQKPGESDETYRARITKRQNDYAAAYSANLSKGVAVHYDDQTIQHNAISPGAAGGAKQIWDLNEQQIFSALDIPPSMCGRTFSTTETYAEVDFERLITKLVNARRMIKRFLEKGYELDLQLQGLEANVTVSFHQNSNLKELERQQAEGEKIDNVLKKRDGGMIDDDEAARELGYEEATGSRSAGAGLAAKAGFFRARFAFDRTSGRYALAPERLVVAKFEAAPDRLDQSYVATLQAEVATAEDAALKVALTKARALASGNIPAETWAKAVFGAFADALLRGLAASKVDKVTARFVGDAWQRARYEDKNHLQASGVRPWRLTRRQVLMGLDLKVTDRNALRYLTSIDNFYFGAGNYLADDAAGSAKFVGWLQKEYIAKGLNIKDAATWDEFNKEFPKLVKESSYRKTVQLVSTTMSRVQNMGQTLSLYEMGFERYRIAGPRTRPICEYCLAMLDRVFEVKVAAERLAKIVDKGFEDKSQLPPFLAGYRTVEDVQGMSDAELQDAGFETPPYHPECRHRKVAED